LIFIAVTADHTLYANTILLNAFPSVCPNPLGTYCSSNLTVFASTSLVTNLGAQINFWISNMEDNTYGINIFIFA